MTVRFLDVVPRVPVTNLEQVTAFYRDTLGFSIENTFPEQQPTFAMMRRDDAQLQFYRTTNAAHCGGVMLNIEVTDAEAMHASLRDRVHIEWGPEVYWYGRREFAVRDPEGNLVIVTAEV